VSWRVLLLFVVLPIAACPIGTPGIYDVAQPCSVDDDCTPGRCVNGECAAEPADAGADDDDAGAGDDDAGAGDDDAGAGDAGHDAGHDAGAADAGFDGGAATDAGDVDAGFDAGAAPDAGDAGFDAGAVPDAGDAGFDAGFDAGPPPDVRFGDGRDGAAVVTGTVDLSVASASGRGVPDAPAFRVTAVQSSSVTLDVAPGSLLAPGDLAVLITLRGSRPGGTPVTANVGAWEVVSVAGVTGQDVSFASALARTYGPTSNVDLQEHVVALVRVPQYESVVVSSGGALTTRAFQPPRAVWANNDLEGPPGGVLVVRARTSIVVSTGGAVDASQLGYRGGPTGPNGDDEAQQGESLGGFGDEGAQGDGSYVYNRYNGVRLANVGGGGAFITGAGGGHGTAGTDAERYRDDRDPPVGGSAYGDAPLDALHLGSGGGGVFRNDNSFECGLEPGPGGRGGGIVWLSAPVMTITGEVLARGEQATAGETVTGGTSRVYGAGGGAGGAIRLTAPTLTLTGATVDATGGKGQEALGCFIADVREGGDGGAGRIRVDFDTLDGNARGSGGADAALSAAVNPAPHEAAP
jgi:hypothetical protein